MNRNGAVVNAHVIAVIENEWSQMRRNRVIVFTTFAPPVLFMMLAITVLVLSSWIDVNAASLAQLHSALIQHVNTQNSRGGHERGATGGGAQAVLDAFRDAPDYCAPHGRKLLHQR